MRMVHTKVNWFKSSDQCHCPSIMYYSIHGHKITLHINTQSHTQICYKPNSCIGIETVIFITMKHSDILSRILTTILSMMEQNKDKKRAKGQFNQIQIPLVFQNIYKTYAYDM
jgi:hypothetical protein